MWQSPFLWMTIAVGLYMAWNIGANDVANAMGTSVGSGALTFKKAVIIAAIFELLGAVLVGGHVTDTVRKGIVDPLVFQGEPMLLVIGMMSSLLSAALWLHLASFLGWPVSTTHSIVGAVAGFGIVGAGFASVKGGTLGVIVLSWVTSPLVGALIALTVFRVCRKRILDASDPVAAMIRVGPWLVLPVFLVLTLALIYKGLKNLKLDLPLGEAVLIGIGVGICSAFVAWLLLRRIKVRDGADRREQLEQVEKAFGWLQILTACYVAFAHGSNDVANAVGPLAAVVGTLSEGTVNAQVALPVWVLWVGGIGIVVGLATYGKNVMATIGTKITELTPSRGFAATFGAATTILIGSKLGMPLSTTHTMVGAVIGVGLARGITALNMSVIRGVVASWVITLPFAGLLSGGLFWAIGSVTGYL